MRYFIQLSEPFQYSLACLSPVKFASTAIVFAHGFCGSARSTFRDFANMGTIHWWEDADLYFLQYDSVGTSNNKSAEKLGKFVEWIASNPDEILDINPGDFLYAPPISKPVRLRPSLSYERMILVGHSQGGIVMRLMLRNQVDDDGKLNGLKMALDAPLRLFAPATMGVRLARLTGALAAAGEFAALAKIMAGASPSYKEMNQSSQLLSELRESTKDLAKATNWPAFKANVVWPETENIVIDMNYSTDHKLKTRPPGTNHVSVCKPRPTYVAPLKFVEKGDLT